MINTQESSGIREEISASMLTVKVVVYFGRGGFGTVGRGPSLGSGATYGGRKINLRSAE